MFLSAAVSGGGQTPDQSEEFRRGIGTIDLTEFGAPSYRFVGSDAFADGVTTSADYDQRRGFVELWVDKNGDGAMDFGIDLMGLRALAKSDILF